MSDSIAADITRPDEIIGAESEPFCWQNLTFVLAFGMFLITRIFNWFWRPSPVFGGDTPMYLPSGDQTRFQLVDFFGNTSRPGVMTGLYALLNDPHLIVRAQHLLSAAVWLTLLVVVARVPPIPRAARAISALGLAAIASLPTITSWNDVLMSESFALSWMAALSVIGVVIWGHRAGMSQTSWMIVCSSAAIFTVLLGPLRPLSLGFTAVLLLVQLAAVFRAIRLGHREQKLSPIHGARLATGSLLGAVALCCAIGYVTVVDSRANFAWGQEFAGLDDFNGRVIQQLTVVSDSSDWAYDTYWYYINSVGDPCIEAGFGRASTGQRPRCNVPTESVNSPRFFSDTMLWTMCDLCRCTSTRACEIFAPVGLT